MESTKVMVEFVIGGDDVNPSEITQLLKINPTKIGIKEERLHPEKKENIENFWEISSEYESSFDINNQINPIFKKISKKKEIIKELLNRPKIDIYGIFNIVIIVENELFPAIYLNTDLIKFMGETGLEIGFDIYYNS